MLYNYKPYSGVHCQSSNEHQPKISRRRSSPVTNVKIKISHDSQNHKISFLVRVKLYFLMNINYSFWEQKILLCMVKASSSSPIGKCIGDWLLSNRDQIIIIADEVRKWY